MMAGAMCWLDLGHLDTVHSASSFTRYNSPRQILLKLKLVNYVVVSWLQRLALRFCVSCSEFGCMISNPIHIPQFDGLLPGCSSLRPLFFTLVPSPLSPALFRLFHRSTSVL